MHTRYTRPLVATVSALALAASMLAPAAAAPAAPDKDPASFTDADGNTIGLVGTPANHPYDDNDQQ